MRRSFIVPLAFNVALLAGMTSAAKTFSSTTQAGYVHNAHAQLDTISVHIREAEAKARHLDTAAREECQKDLQNLHRKERTARARLEEIRKAPHSAWQRLRKQEDTLLVRLQKSYQHLINQYFR